MTAHITFFRPGELVLMLEGNPEASPDNLRGPLSDLGIRVSGYGERVVVTRDGTTRVLQTFYVDGRETGQPPLIPVPGPDDYDKVGQSMQAVLDAVQTLNGPRGAPGRRPAVDTGTFKLHAASPNWLALPFQW